MRVRRTWVGALSATLIVLGVSGYVGIARPTASAARDVCDRKPDLAKCVAAGLPSSSPAPTGTTSPTASPSPSPVPTAGSILPTASPSASPTGTATTTAGSTPAPSAAPTGVPVPAAVASDCSTDVTAALLSWIGSVPDGTTLLFGAGKCYRIEGTLEIRGRSGLVFDGNGSTFRSTTAPADQRAFWRAIDSRGLVFRNMTIVGSYASGGTFTAGLQHAHGVDLRGTSAQVSAVSISDVAGDCVYFGLGYSAATRSSGGVTASTCRRTGRNGVAVSAGDDIRIEGNRLDAIGLNATDIEPNQGAGWGSRRVVVDSNTIGRYKLYAYAVVLNAPLSEQSFTRNRIQGQGLRIGLVDPGRTSYRAAGVTIAGNASDTAQWAPAIEATSIDGLSVTGNTVPMSGGTMATVADSCRVSVSGNSYPGGTAQVGITSPSC
jgi:hypothetical protein